MRPAPAAARPFPWAAAMGAGFGLLRLSPDAFWRMTPRELAAAVSALLPPAPDHLSRPDLSALMKRFPDLS
ncbi:rcc01693 family protein [Xanthobacter oligotrophicus]|uniref:rcc01693 family protein n=1 Tax=Xanthobacter oligotrophicus TaxID=2607286 RepID=UPI0011F17D27|nr:rcc01693 family protein [Xanthobacter oligotrophicus]